MTIKTDQPTEDLTLDNFGTDETAMARDLAQRIHRIQSGQIDGATQPPPTSTKTKSATHCMTFNPLHPSMELPPEQLIRLRNMHAQQISKEARKGSSKRHHSASKQTARTEPAQFSRIEEEYSEDNNHQTKKWLLTGGFILLCIAGYIAMPIAPETTSQSITSDQTTVQKNPAAAINAKPEQNTKQPVANETTITTEKTKNDLAPKTIYPAASEAGLTESAEITNSDNIQPNTTDIAIDSESEISSVDNNAASATDIIIEPEAGIAATAEITEAEVNQAGNISIEAPLNTALPENSINAAESSNADIEDTTATEPANIETPGTDVIEDFSTNADPALSYEAIPENTTNAAESSNADIKDTTTTEPSNIETPDTDVIEDFSTDADPALSYEAIPENTTNAAESSNADIKDTTTTEPSNIETPDTDVIEDFSTDADPALLYEAFPEEDL